MEEFSNKEIESTSNIAKKSFAGISAPITNVSSTQAFRLLVTTWNVGGKPPHDGLDLSNLLPADEPSDVYVFGFQEIVPLNAANVIVSEATEPAVKWLNLIDQALKRATKADSANCLDVASCSYKDCGARVPIGNDLKASNGQFFFQKPSLKLVNRTFRTELGRRLKSCNCNPEVTRKYYKDSCFICPKPYTSDDDSSEEEERSGFSLKDLESLASVSANQQKYCLIASKQMVGIFISIWVRKDLVQYVGHLRLCCVGCGIMGYLGNKGCISVSLTLHQTSFCFICSHLASGEKEGDELRRNSAVMEILKNTQFPRICKLPGRKIPEKILEHDQVIWLGDLNYRISLSYSETKKLLEDQNWDALFEKDQLKIEREAGRVFKGWKEGKIYFPPTYKYSTNSDAYAGESIQSKDKRRTPAWCDRILWHGDGITLLSYIRGESRFSDHRPVSAAFLIEVALLSDKQKEKQSSKNMKVGAEELLPVTSS